MSSHTGLYSILSAPAPNASSLSSPLLHAQSTSLLHAQNTSGQNKTTRAQTQTHTHKHTRIQTNHFPGPAPFHSPSSAPFHSIWMLLPALCERTGNNSTCINVQPQVSLTCWLSFCIASVPIDSHCLVPIPPLHIQGHMRAQQTEHTIKIGILRRLHKPHAG